MFVGGLLSQCAGFFAIYSWFAASVATSFGAVLGWFAVSTAWFALVGFAMAWLLRADPGRLEPVVASGIGLLVPGLVGWFALPGSDLAGQQFWTVLVSLLGGAFASAFCCAVASYVGGRLAERLFGFSRPDAA